MIQEVMQKDRVSAVKKAPEFNCRDFRLDFSSKTYIMGILNITPDSFYDGGRFFSKEQALRRISAMIEEGADIIDIGGQSTRPGSESISSQEEMDRVLPIIEAIVSEIHIPISIDTFNHCVAAEALEKGASIVNDVTGLRGDSEMPDVIAHYGAGTILMHIKGTPKNMQDNPVYDDVLGDILGYLKDSVGRGISAGISPDSIAIDPGIGFGKTLEHNLVILRHLNAFKALGKPILIGVSRKSFIGKILLSLHTYPNFL